MNKSCPVCGQRISQRWESIGPVRFCDAMCVVAWEHHRGARGDRRRAQRRSGERRTQSLRIGPERRAGTRWDSSDRRGADRRTRYVEAVA